MITIKNDGDKRENISYATQYKRKANSLRNR